MNITNPISKDKRICDIKTAIFLPSNSKCSDKLSTYLKQPILVDTISPTKKAPITIHQCLQDNLGIVPITIGKLNNGSLMIKSLVPNATSSVLNIQIKGTKNISVAIKGEQ